MLKNSQVIPSASPQSLIKSRIERKMSAAKADERAFAQAQKVTGEAEVRGNFVDTHGVVTTSMNDLPGYRVKKVKQPTCSCLENCC